MDRTALAYAYEARTTDYDGALSERLLTAAEADNRIAYAVADGDEIAPDTDLSGRLTITRTITGWDTACGQGTSTRRRVIRLNPTARPRRLTKRQHEDLRLVLGQEDTSMPAWRDGARVRTGFASIPPAAAERLFAAGWLIEEPDVHRTVSVSYAGRVAMVLHEHRTETGYRGTDKEAVRTDGSRYWASGDPLYRSLCSCGHRAERLFERKEAAQAASRTHRADALRALFT